MYAEWKRLDKFFQDYAEIMCMWQLLKQERGNNTNEIESISENCSKIDGCTNIVSMCKIDLTITLTIHNCIRCQTNGFTFFLRC